MPIRKVPERIVEVPYSNNMVTEIDMWKLTNTWHYTSVSTFIDITDISPYTVGGFSPKGAGMSISSGIFTFPSTGYYKIEYTMAFVSPGQSSAFTGGAIRLSEDNFATGGDSIVGYSNMFTTSIYTMAEYQTIFKVDSTATHKCKFQVYSQETVYVEPDRTNFRFIKLGEI